MKAEALSDALSNLLGDLLRALDALDWVQRRLHPAAVSKLIEELSPLEPQLAEALLVLRSYEWPDPLKEEGGRIEVAAEHTIAALAGFVEQRAEAWMAALDPSSIFPLYGALRRRIPALEALYPLSSALLPVSRFFLEKGYRSSKDLVARLARVPSEEPAVPVGIVDGKNDRTERGGFSVYVPEYYDADRTWPLVVACHGGSGHGADFLWTWLREARSRGFLVLSPTSYGRTWSLQEPRLDGDRVEEMVAYVSQKWRVNRDRVLLTGMSDGATFTLLAGFGENSPFTHLAPISGVLTPLPKADRARVEGKPIYLVHGALDWMFPVETARMASKTLEGLGAEVVFREIADLSHTYPREENARILEWLDPSLGESDSRTH